MKKKTLLSVLLLAIFASTMVFTACSKEGEILEEEEETGAIINLVAENTNVKPLEVVALIGKDANFSEDRYSASIGGETIDVLKTNDTTLAFVIPLEISGAQPLNINISGNDYSINFNISDIEQINNPDLYINDFVTQMNISATDPYNLNLQDSLDLVMQDYNNLTSEEKQHAAQFIAANRVVLDEINTILNTTTLKTFPAKSTTDALFTFHFKSVTANYLLCVTKLAIPVVGFGVIGATIAAEYSLGTAAWGGWVAGGVVGIGFVKIFMKSTIARTGTLWTSLTTETFEAADAELFQTKLYTYNNDQANSIDFHVTLENLQNKSYSQSWLSTLIFVQSKFKTIWNDIFGSAHSPNYASLIQETVYADDINNVDVVIINNTNVTGEIGGTTENMTVTFTTDETTDQEFDYKLVYNDGEFEVFTDVVKGNLTTDLCIDNTAPIITSLVRSCDGEESQVRYLIEFETDGVGFNPNASYYGSLNTYPDDYPVRLDFFTSEWQLGANSYTANLIEGDYYNGTIEMIIYAGNCTQTEYYDTEIFYYDFRVSLFDDCGLQSNSIEFPVVYYSHSY